MCRDSSYSNTLPDPIYSGFHSHSSPSCGEVGLQASSELSRTPAILTLDDPLSTPTSLSVSLYLSISLY